MRTIEELDQLIIDARQELEAALGTETEEVILGKSEFLDELLEEYLEVRENTTMCHHNSPH